jgi:putative ABC transport system permease protein
MVGGGMGIALGVTISTLINLALGWRVGIPLDAVLASIGVCGVVGIFFGAYPAQKASQLDPIAALRTN